ncbi:magnesium-dependent phosphatase 1-like [Stegodyphus dumicola]|uniref:magnesium-dependent phosphatase 1-like n=1 Tax=Stegodyphus dumicola TaxID=202533 RepID=UPI0015B2CDBF|nr:magnesium-dependent phosphatase 1-like [Stegodyphus dumicola]
MQSAKLVVFDLDYTLWPFWVDTNLTSPFKKENNSVIDGCGKKIKYYPEVPEVLEKLKQEGYILGVASRTDWPEGARKLLKLFDWNKYFTYTEIYPGRKTTHFRRMHEESGIPYSEMLFFDDEQRNISDLKAIGVKSILVNDGVNLKIVEDALKSFKTS